MKTKDDILSLITSIINYLRKSRQDEERERKTGEDTLSEMRILMDNVLSKYEIPYTTEEEIGSGDKISTRPVFQKVIEEVKQGKYNAIAVKEISRLGRGSYTDMGVIYDLIVDKRIFIITPWKIYDPKNPSDLRQIRFELFLSREEFETIRERLIGARYNYALQGKWMAGQPPFGYKPNEKQVLMPDESADNGRHISPAQTIRLIAQYFLHGLNGKDIRENAICTQLKRMGIPTPKGKSEWRPIQIKRILSNPVYNGQVCFRITEKKNGVNIERPEHEHIVIENAHEKLINDEDWQQIQNKMENRNKIPKTKLDFSPCELASLLVCKKCGRKMVRQYSIQKYKKKDGEISTYNKEFLWCTTHGCTFVKYRDVENDILEFLQYLQDLDGGKLKEILEFSINKKSEKTIDVAEIKKQMEQRRKELRNRLKFIFDKYEAGIYSDEDFLARKKEIEEELRSLDNVVVEENKEIKNPINVEIVKSNINTILNTYKNLKNKTQKNNLLHLIIDDIEIEITEKGRGRKSSTFEITISLKQAISRDFLLV